VLQIVAGMAVCVGSQAFAGGDHAEVLADAANRTSMLAQSGSGYNNGAFALTDGGNNTLNIGGTTQFRYNASFRDDSTVGDQEDFTHGFNGPTQRLRFWGTIWDSALSFKIEGNFSSENPGGGTFNLEDAWAAYTWDSGNAVYWGQQKLNLHRADIVDNEYQLSMDRSITSAVFSGGYVQGLSYHMNADQFHLAATLHDGIGSQNSDFTSGAEADFGVALRVEFAAMGTDWNRWADFTSWRSATDNALLIGGGINYQSGGETGGTADVDAWTGSVDVSFEGKGFNIFGAIYGAHIDTGGGDFENFGAELGAGFFLSDQAELFARGDYIMLDEDVFGGDEDQFFLTAGVNYYISPESHAVKFTGQVGYAFNDTSNIFGGGGLVSDTTRYSYLGDTEEGEIAVGAQVQVKF
jgi:hypothetical protein